MRADDPVALPRMVTIGIAAIFVDSFDQAEYQVVVSAEYAGALHDANVGHGFQFRGNGFQPLVSLSARTSRQQDSTKFEVVLHQDDPRPATSGGEGRHQSRRTGTDYQYIAKCLGLFVMGRVRRCCSGTQSCSLPDEVFIDEPGLAGRAHECLVVKAGREQLGKQSDRAQYVEAQRRPPVLAPGDEFVVQLHACSADVGNDAVPGLQCKQRIGLLDARRVNAARPVVLETARDEPHAIGQ